MCGSVRAGSPMAIDNRSLVSIVIPCFNYGHYLGYAVDSALAQTYKPIEVIVVDDGSEDDTAAVVARYGSAVTYRRKANGGLSSARNTGARGATGDHIVFLDADNLLDPKYVERCVTVMQECPDAGFVYTQLHYFGGSEGTSSFPTYDVAKLKRHNTADACALIRADVVKAH